MKKNNQINHKNHLNIHSSRIQPFLSTSQSYQALHPQSLSRCYPKVFVILLTLLELKRQNQTNILKLIKGIFDFYARRFVPNHTYSEAFHVVADCGVNSFIYRRPFLQKGKNKRTSCFYLLTFQFLKYRAQSCNITFQPFVNLSNPAVRKNMKK